MEQTTNVTNIIPGNTNPYLPLCLPWDGVTFPLVILQGKNDYIWLLRAFICLWGWKRYEIRLHVRILSSRNPCFDPWHDLFMFGKPHTNGRTTWRYMGCDSWMGCGPESRPAPLSYNVGAFCKPCLRLNRQSLLVIKEILYELAFFLSIRPSIDNAIKFREHHGRLRRL